MASPGIQRSVIRSAADGSELYSETSGSGEPVLLLHGGFCSLESLRPLGETLAEQYLVAAFERPGHGRSADVAGPFSYDKGVTDALAYLDELGLPSAHVIGYSDGAIIGLLLALRHPDRVRSLVSISGNLDPSGFVEAVGVDGADEDSDDEDGADAVAPVEPVPDAAAEKPDREQEWYEALSPDGPEHAGVVLEKLFALWTSEPHIDPAELARVTAPTLVMSADGDSIRVDHSQLIASSIPRGTLCIVPGATHGLVADRHEFVSFVVREFLAANRTEPSS